MTASINQDNDDIVYGSSQRLNIRRSTNGGFNFASVSPGLEPGDFTAFSAPYELAPSNQDIIYAGGTYLYKATDGATVGSSWFTASSGPVDVNPILKIAISYSNPDLLFVTTSPDPTNGPSGAKIFKSEDGGQTFTQLTSGLPNRICKDIEFDPTDDNIAYAVFSGFGSNHVYKTIDAGNSWSAIDNGVPDVPANTILIDPLNPDDIYLGNDLGVYYSENGGIDWLPFSEALPDAVMIYDLNDSPSNRKIRIATHGHGIWQRSYVNDFLSVDEVTSPLLEIQVAPNPVTTELQLLLSSALGSNIKIKLFSMNGQLKLTEEKTLQENIGIITLSISDLASGAYLLSVSTADNKTIIKTIIKE